MRLACLAVASTLLLASARGDTLTYPDLCNRLTDLDHLAVLPPVGEKTSLASSYDRGSKYDAASDKYLAWDANGDGQGLVSQDANSVTMADLTGPGCIDRIWSAAPADGHVRIYLDGSSTPAVDLPFNQYFGKAAPFNRPNIDYHTGAADSGQESGGWNNYTPIPFQKSCKIVADKNWGSYFHFNYTQFAPGTIVPTFTSTLSPQDSAALDKANAILGRCGEEPVKHAGETIDTRAITLAPGQKFTVLDLTGEQAITAIKASLSRNLAGKTGTSLFRDPEAQRHLLREVALQITWDDDDEPAVWSPIGDFFGFVGGGAPFKTLPVGLNEDGWFYSYWYMPFAKKAHVEALNDGDRPVSLVLKISHAPLTQPIDTLARFHAKWHRDAFLPTRADRMPDWTLLTTQGRGRFVGTHLHVWNPNDGWWGEGDEKFFVDGEKFPSTFGTGSEDYFGYAWGRVEYFSRPFHSQPLNENNIGHIDDNRWHISDNVPFQTSFEGCIEKYQNNQQDRYAADAFWYLAPGGTDPYPAQPVQDRTDYWITSLVVPDVIKGKDMTVLGKPQEIVAQGQYLFQTQMRMWSNDTTFWWMAKSLGEHLDLQFPVKTAGTYRVLIRPTHAPNYGIGQLSIDGKDTGAPIDLYYREVTAVDAISLGTMQLSAGPHTLGITVTGKNSASQGYYFGFDWLRLEPQAQTVGAKNKFD
jgi:hypothetical protein